MSNQNANTEANSIDGATVYESLGLCQPAEIAKVKQAIAAGQNSENKNHQQTIRTSSNTNFKR